VGFGGIQSSKKSMVRSIGNKIYSRREDLRLMPEERLVVEGVEERSSAKFKAH